MDNIKDIQTSNIAKFFDQEVKTNPFGENRSAERAYKRAERIIAALFLLTNHIDPMESLRTETRQIALALLPQILELRDHMRSIGSAQVIHFQSSIRRLVSHIKILSVAGHVSDQNAEVITEAIDELGTFVLLAQKSHLSESITISRETFIDQPIRSKGHLKDIRDTLTIKDKAPLKDGSLGFGNHENRGSRGMVIMDVLKKGGDLSIRDIASNLPEYGEKMIQRELVLLIRAGSVNKSGSKRWSRYSLVPQSIS